ncbi:MAG: ferrous iron transport protein A [Clostridia bacterium]|nr:ferrous iron transport protein A [Clostridia bacterium]
MIPLTYANPQESGIIKKIGGNPEVKRHLENLGFVVGAEIRVVNSVGGNLIVSVKEVRVALSKELAQKVMI